MTYVIYVISIVVVVGCTDTHYVLGSFPVIFAIS